MSRLDTSVAPAREAGFWDREEILADPFADPLERAAIVNYELTYNPPETVASALDNVKACEATAERWRRLPRPTRNLHRRRAALELEAAQRRPSGAR